MRGLLALVIVFPAATLLASPETLLKQMSPSALLLLHKDRAHLAKLPRSEKTLPPFQDLKVLFHIHSSLSHDSQGTLQEILRAAHLTGVKALFMSEHPRDDLDVVNRGLKGKKEGVYFFPGAETNQFLLYPAEDHLPNLHQPQQQLIDEIRSKGGLVFLSHPEEQKDWSLQHLTGMEMYNTHADLKRDFPRDWMHNKTIKKLFNGVALQNILQGFSQHPVEAFAALYNYPQGYLSHFEKLFRRAPLLGIAANDSHQNVKLFGVQLDPYPVSFGYVSTHLLAREDSKEAILEAIRWRRGYVAFDWLADPKGFLFYAESGDRREPMGAALAWKKGMALQIHSPLPGKILLLKDGKPLQQTAGTALSTSPPAPGLYRAEVYLELPETREQRLWILSNPILLK